MADAQTTLLLKTDNYTSGLTLDIAPWKRSSTANAREQALHQTDWSGGLYQKMIPKEGQMPNMAWSGQCWTVHGYELRAGPLRSAITGQHTYASTRTFGLTEYSKDSVLYFAQGTKKYSYSASTNTTTEVDSGGTAAVTQVREIGANLIFCLGPGTNYRSYSGSAWANGTYGAQCIVWHRDKIWWASNGGSGTLTSYLYWGTGASQNMLIGKSNSGITDLVDVDGTLLIFKTDSVYEFVYDPSNTNHRAVLIQQFPTWASTGIANAYYNGALYFGAGQGLWCWRGTGPAMAVPVPDLIDSGQIGRVWSLESIDMGLLVGFSGYVYLVIEDPPQSGRYWWHYVAKNSSAEFHGLKLCTGLASLPRPRLFLGCKSDATQNLYSIDFLADTFLPYAYETGTAIIFPGIYTGPEMHPAWYKNIVCGTRFCAAGITITYHYSTDLTNWTAFGSAVAANGFTTVTPTANVNGRVVWIRATFATNSSTISPALDFWRIYYRPRNPLLRQWIFPVLVLKGAQLQGWGGKQLDAATTLAALDAARGQTNPCTITLPEEALTDLNVLVDLEATTRRVDDARREVTQATYSLICTEA